MQVAHTAGARTSSLPRTYVNAFMFARMHVGNITSQSPHIPTHSTPVNNVPMMGQAAEAMESVRRGETCQI